MTSWADVANGTFETLGSIFLWLSVASLYRAKGYAGVYIGQMLFYTTWGVWNLIYYPSLDQWVSFLAGINVLAANLAWVCLAFYYGKKG